jgi:hypothetical protein
LIIPLPEHQSTAGKEVETVTPDPSPSPPSLSCRVPSVAATVTWPASTAAEQVIMEVDTAKLVSVMLKLPNGSTTRDPDTSDGVGASFSVLPPPIGTPR